MRNTNSLFRLLSTYVIIQFLWWGYHIIDLTYQIEGNTAIGVRKMTMIIGEGIVFLGILIMGILRIRKSIRAELEVSRNQTNFMLSITHELKTPIASSKLYLQTLQKHSLSDEKKAELLQKTLQQNEQLEHLIDNILNASRLESKRLELNKEEVNVSNFIKSILDCYEKQYPTIQFKQTIAPNIQAKIDPFIIETIVNNLIENAIKYAGLQSTIEVRLALNERLVLSVIDNGPGIPFDKIKDVFKKFYRIGNEETRTQKGSGLGLFIVKELSHLHQGQIRYSNNLPSGAHFEISIKTEEEKHSTNK